MRLTEFGWGRVAWILAALCARQFVALIKDLKSELRETGYRGAVRVESRVKVAVEWIKVGQAGS